MSLRLEVGSSADFFLPFTSVGPPRFYLTISIFQAISSFSSVYYLLTYRSPKLISNCSFGFANNAINHKKAI